MRHKETFCCEEMRTAITLRFIRQWATKTSRGVYATSDGDDEWEFSFCPFCGADLRETKDARV
jgi:hypothetical protein